MNRTNASATRIQPSWKPIHHLILTNFVHEFQWNFNWLGNTHKRNTHPVYISFFFYSSEEYSKRTIHQAYTRTSRIYTHKEHPHLAIKSANCMTEHRTATQSVLKKYTSRLLASEQLCTHHHITTHLGEILQRNANPESTHQNGCIVSTMKTIVSVDKFVVQPFNSETSVTSSHRVSLTETSTHQIDNPANLTAEKSPLIRRVCAVFYGELFQWAIDWTCYGVTATNVQS